jgi:uncharacterized membrane protein YagU involved in acid resistance
MNKKVVLTVKSGLIATAVMTMMMLVAPMMGMPKMPIGDMLAGFMHMPVAIGWTMHFVIGTMLAAGYILFFKSKLPGSDLIKGILFGLIPFLMAQLVVMPMMGAGVFSSNTGAPAMMVMGSLIGHMVYGAVLGATARE